MSKILVIGGGAAGMMYAVHAAQKDHEVHIVEQNEKLGKKLYITGKGRCNVTNACDDVEELLGAVVSNPKFLYSAFYGYTNKQVMEFFEQAGVPLKTERGGRVFPVSDHSSDIIRALEKRLRELGVHIHLHTKVKSLVISEESAAGVLLADGTRLEGDAVVVATGGLSYTSTGSTGDGYTFAVDTGHKVTDIIPSLVPLRAEEEYIKELQGLSLKNVTFTLLDGKKNIYSEFGEMMFTHFGVTGPIVLSASAYAGRRLQKKKLRAEIDLKPALTADQLDARILREFQAAQNKQFKNVIGALYPSSLTPVIIRLCGISPEKPIHDVTKQEREEIVNVTKHFPLTITGTGEFKEAIITKGGVSVIEVNPSTMESKKIRNLYFIGEVLDLDAVTGGYNLQIAWSTAWLAASQLDKFHEKGDYRK